MTVKEKQGLIAMIDVLIDSSDASTSGEIDAIAYINGMYAVRNLVAAFPTEERKDNAKKDS